MAVETAPEPMRRDGRISREMCDLPPSVHARVGARRALHLHRRADHTGERLFQMLLDRGCVVLALPARQTRAVVFHDQLDDQPRRIVSHAASPLPIKARSDVSELEIQPSEPGEIAHRQLAIGAETINFGVGHLGKETSASFPPPCGDGSGIQKQGPDLLADSGDAR